MQPERKGPSLVAFKKALQGHLLMHFCFIILLKCRLVCSFGCRKFRVYKSAHRGRKWHLITWLRPRLFTDDFEVLSENRLLFNLLYNRLKDCTEEDVALSWTLSSFIPSFNLNNVRVTMGSLIWSRDIICLHILLHKKNFCIVKYVNKLCL